MHRTGFLGYECFPNSFQGREKKSLKNIPTVFLLKYKSGVDGHVLIQGVY